MKKLWLLILVLIGTLPSAVCAERGVLICVSREADPRIKAAAKTLNEAEPYRALTGSGTFQSAPELIDSESLLLPPNARDGMHLQLPEFRKAAFNSLILVGLPEQDPLLKKCWGHQIGLQPGALDVLGYGSWKGDFGTVECDWNPFLYSREVKNNAYTTVLIKLSGTSVAGVLAAVKAFQSGLLNGIVPAGTGELAATSILDLKPDLTPPPALPEKLGAFFRAGWTQPSAMEYRAYQELAGMAPERVWRVKYLAPGVNDDVSAKAWVNGLHRLAYGNAVTIAEFRDEAGPVAALTELAARRGARKETLAGNSGIVFDQPRDEALSESYGQVRYFAAGRRLVAVSLPAEECATALESLGPGKNGEK